MRLTMRTKSQRRRQQLNPCLLLICSPSRKTNLQSSNQRPQGKPKAFPATSFLCWLPMMISSLTTNLRGAACMCRTMQKTVKAGNCSICIYIIRMRPAVATASQSCMRMVRGKERLWLMLCYGKLHCETPLCGVVLQA